MKTFAIGGHGSAGRFVVRGRLKHGYDAPNSSRVPSQGELRPFSEAGLFGDGWAMRLNRIGHNGGLQIYTAER